MPLCCSLMSIMGSGPILGARPVLLQLDPELRAAVEALARAEGQSVEYVLLQCLAEQAQPKNVTQ